MYAYVDESGNTGNRLFDPQQPLFVTAAMMTKANFDAIRAADIAEIARKVGVAALHANELGTGRIEIIADDLQRVIKQVDARFFLSRVEKMYLGATKVMDSYFDAGENLAVPWQIYWVRPLRLTLTFKLAHYIATEQIARTVWDALTVPNPREAKRAFLDAAAAMLARAPNLPDARSRQIVTDAMEWAIANPENFSAHTRIPKTRNTHSPNFVAFTNLLEGLDKMSKLWKRSVREIVHDRQSEFEKTFQDWHATVSRPDPALAKPIHWPGEDQPFTLGRATGSRFRTATDETSPGLQVVDVALWLFKRALSDKEIGPRGAALLRRVMMRGFQSDFSFNGVGSAVEERLEQIWNEPITEEQMRKGAEFQALSEQRRLSAMVEYAQEKVSQPPT